VWPILYDQQSRAFDQLHSQSQDAPLNARAQLDVGIGSPRRPRALRGGKSSSEEALVGPIDTNVSIDVIVQWTCLLAFAWNLTLNGLASDRVVGPGSQREAPVRQQNAANDTSSLQR